MTSMWIALGSSFAGATLTSASGSVAFTIEPLLIGLVVLVALLILERNAK